MADPITIVNKSGDARARVLPAIGFNCYEFAVLNNGKWIDVLWTDPEFTQGTTRAAASGFPILFPFPGRIRGTTLTFRGETWPLAAGDGRGNAIHGFVLDRPWRVIEQAAERLVGQFQASVDDPGILEQWPCDFRLTVEYRFDGAALDSKWRVENPGRSILPFGLGTHPYFRAPIAAGTRPEECVVTVPAGKYWPLADMLPTGELLPAVPPRNLTAGKAFSDCQFDDVLAGLEFRDHWCRATIRDVPAGLTTVLSFDDAFRECVVYNPPHRQAISIEPYTCVPNAIELADRGIDSGLGLLEPGQSMTGRIRVALLG